MTGSDDAPTPSPASSEPRRLAASDAEKLADFLHVSLNSNIALADRKAGIVFTLVTAALLFLFESRPPSEVFARGSDLVALLWLAVAATLVAAAICTLLVIYPRLRGARESLASWYAVGRLPSAEAFRAAVEERLAGALGEVKLEHCHALACVCRAKFRLLRTAMALAVIGLTLFLTAVAITESG